MLRFFHNPRTRSSAHFVETGMEQQLIPQDQPLAVTEQRDHLLHVHDRTDAVENTTDMQEETATAAAALMTLLQEEAINRRKETGLSLAWSGAFVVSMLWLIRHTGTTEAAITLNLLFCFAFMGIVGWGLCFHLSRRSYRRKHSLTNALSQINSRKDVAPLIRTLQVQNTPVRNRAKAGLIALLPTIRASDALLLGEQERKILLQQLAILPNDSGYRDLKELFSRSAFRREMDFRLAILKSLEQVGGEQELPAVERLARGLPALHNPVKIPLELQTAAKECLPYLQSRANDQRASAQLLRASGFPAASGADLLRPAASGVSTPPEHLLRASELQP